MYVPSANGCNGTKTTSGSAYDRLGGTSAKTTYFNTACFVQQSVSNPYVFNRFQYGNESRTDSTLRGPGQAGADPLGDFLNSLDRLEPYDADEVLPAHEHRFVSLDGRLAELRAHHERRFAEVVAAIADGTTTAWEIASRMRWAMNQAVR